jgi:tRNA G18 (ribose-2'-O)-methylase SpoU
MLHVRHIDSLDLPELEPYRTMKRTVEHEEKGLFVAEGQKVVRRLLESRLTVLSLLLPESWLKELMPLLDRRAEEIHAYVAPKAELEKMIGYTMYQGVLALGKIPRMPSLEEVLEASPRPYLFAAVDGLSNAENLGVLVRNCSAFGVQALLVGETSSSPYLRRAVRSSMGTVFELTVVEVGHLAGTLSRLRERGVRSIAAHPHTDRRTISQADFKGDSCIVFGSEGLGLSAEVLAACDDAVLIPMQATVDSLNVGSASAVFLYEARRQRDQM